MRPTSPEPPYHRFGVEDFLMDDFFQQWVREPTWETNAFWQPWLLNHPHMQEAVQEARQLLQELDFQEDLPTEAAHLRVWQRITATSSALEAAPQPERAEAPVRRLRPWRALAASLVGVLVLIGCVLYVLNRPQEQLYQTGFAEVKSVMLPDGSGVTLNANSSLRVGASWKPGQDREVWLDGEAFFSVTPTPDQLKFVVHASEAVRVEVLGTEFNVYQRERGTRVVLRSGKVQLAIGEGGKAQKVLMQPGDLVEIAKDANTYTRNQIRHSPERFTSWKDRRIIFDDTPVAELVAVLEDTYGVRVTVEDPALLDKRLWGTVPLGDLGEVLTGLEKTFTWRITRNQNNIHIRP